MSFSINWPRTNNWTAWLRLPRYQFTINDVSINFQCRVHFRDKFTWNFSTLNAVKGYFRGPRGVKDQMPACEFGGEPNNGRDSWIIVWQTANSTKTQFCHSSTPAIDVRNLIRDTVFDIRKIIVVVTLFNIYSYSYGTSSTCDVLFDRK